MKILTILGARPQFIKAGSVSRALSGYPEINEVIVHTGQHYDLNMSDIFFEEMKIPKPDYHLGVGNLSHGAMTGRMIEKVEEVCIKEKPDWVMVYGDTNSTLAGALTASKLHIKIAHVEAGLRSFNMFMPEEVNRILTDRISTVLFCPTDTAVSNLRVEGFDRFICRIVKCGDVMKDGALYYRQFARKPDTLSDINCDYTLCTIHRAENTDDPKRFSGIIAALNEISTDVPVVLPMHPRTKNILRIANVKFAPSVHIIEPVGYLEMVYLINHCQLVMTDSGGLQKEAFFFSRPCITLRDETEWVELVDGGYNILAGAEYRKIIDAYAHRDILNNCNYSSNLYGDGNASEKIVRELLTHG